MRISDWSSDVCSSDLTGRRPIRQDHPSPREVVLTACDVSIAHIVKMWQRKINALALCVSDIHQFAEYRLPSKIRSLGGIGVVDFARSVAFAPRTTDPTCAALSGTSQIGRAPV